MSAINLNRHVGESEVAYQLRVREVECLTLRMEKMQLVAALESIANGNHMGSATKLRSIARAALAKVIE